MIPIAHNLNQGEILKILVLLTLVLGQSLFAQSNDRSLNTILIFEGEGNWVSGKEKGNYTNDTIITFEGGYGVPYRMTIEDSVSIYHEKKEVSYSQETLTYVFDETNKQFKVVKDGAEVGAGSCYSEFGTLEKGFYCNHTMTIEGTTTSEVLQFNGQNFELESAGNWVKGKEQGSWSGVSHIHFRR